MKFNFNTIKDFEAHIELSIPNYVHLIDLVKSISAYFIRENTNVYDLGCSTGSLIKYLSMQNINAIYTGIDISENLLPKDTQGNIITTMGDKLRFRCADIIRYCYTDVSLALLIFTLQFISIRDRYSVLRTLRDSLINEGAVIVAEKVYSETGLIQDICTFAYYDYKRKTFSDEEILQKQFDLRSIMRNMTKEDNESMFSECGFRYVEFFRSLNFIAWILIKK